VVGAGPLRVLIADDDPRVRRALRALVEGERDLAVAGEAADAGGVLAQARALRPVVILLDLLLPRVEDGLALLPALAGWPVVALSVRGGVRAAALAAGAVAFVEKGDTPEVVLAALRAAGEHRDTGRRAGVSPSNGDQP
jgi:DNA-binding NarL/FixJ family response regulator